jgi:TrmH family RNA methyltransferase
MTDPRANIRIVLVRTSHPGNVGAAARAMKAMGLARLVLVAPERFPAPEATALACGADDVLTGARVVDRLDSAIAQCTLVVAASARQRGIPWPVWSPAACAAQVLERARSSQAALVFGPEDAGLTNVELERCHALVKIPTEPDFSSLNLAQAVLVMAYEMRRAATAPPAAFTLAADAPPATAEQLEQLYAHLEQAMIDVGFHDPAKPRRLMRRLRRLIGRCALDQHELQILRGFLAAVQARARPRGADQA